MGHSKVTYVVMVIHGVLYLSLVVYTLIFLRETQTATHVSTLANFTLFVYVGAGYNRSVPEVRTSAGLPCDQVYAASCRLGHGDECCDLEAPRNAAALYGFQCVLSGNSIGVEWEESQWPRVASFIATEDLGADFLSSYYFFHDCAIPFGDAYPLEYGSVETVSSLRNHFDVSVSQEETTYDARIYPSFVRRRGQDSPNLVTLFTHLGKNKQYVMEVEYDFKELIYLSILLLVTIFEIVYVLVSCCKSRRASGTNVRDEQKETYEILGDVTDDIN